MVKMDTRSKKQEVNDSRRKMEDKEVKLENEVKALKRKLEEKDDDLNSSKCQINKLKEELESSRSKTKKQDHLVQQLTDRMECPVCLDIPRQGPVPVCPNGHLVCSKCKTDVCPTCRSVMGSGKSLLASTVLENIEQNCKFEDCNEKLSLQDLQSHESVCHHRIVTCPYANCPVTVPLAELVDHLKISQKCCAENEAPVKTKKDWNRTNYLITNRAINKLNWKMHIYAFAGEIFAVFPLKSEGHFYFVIVMFASEAECSKFKFKMIVHEHGKDAKDSENTVKFCGCPLSIDVKKEDLKLYGAGGKLMAKMLKNTVTFSFKMIKKENI